MIWASIFFTLKQIKIVQYIIRFAYVKIWNHMPRFLYN
nr:MAG TPA: hypothetical protein [Caudoviricetes sp.]